MITKKAIDIINDTNLNAIDIKILAFCYGKKLSVAEVQSQIGVAYKNILPHLKKLERTGLIIINDNGIGKKKEITANTNSLGVQYFMFGLSCLWTNEEILEKNTKLNEEIIKFLKDNQPKA